MELIDLCSTISLAMLGLALALAVFRIVVGPTLPDRILALDLAALLAAGITAVFATRTGFYLYVEIAVALTLVAVLSTAAFARYLLNGKAP